MNRKIYLEDQYLDYLIFSDVEKNQSAKNLFENIGNWIFSVNDQQEAKYLITEMICEIFNLQLKVDFDYRSEVVKTIKNKADYEQVKRKMKLDILRVYKETQDYLKDSNNNGFITLYRSLNRAEIDSFERGDLKINSNILNSFSTDPKYHKRELQISIKIPIKNVLFYHNLCPMNEQKNSYTSLGLFAEREAIVICEKGYFLINQIINYDLDMKRRREIEESYN